MALALRSQIIAVEYGLFEVRPGITDFSSIVFSDEGRILKNEENPDLQYNRIIRPWKNRLGLFYVNNRTFGIDLVIIVTTIVAIISKPIALRIVQFCLKCLGAADELVKVAGRHEPLVAYPPPGAEKIEERY